MGLESLVPWVHYVPVKNDLSDLISNIKWLRENDSKAKEIAKNGRALFVELYSLPKMIDDSASLYNKLASLMKYTPEVPDEKYRWRDEDELFGDFDEEDEEDEEKEDL